MRYKKFCSCPGHLRNMSGRILWDMESRLHPSDTGNRQIDHSLERTSMGMGIQCSFDFRVQIYTCPSGTDDTLRRPAHRNWWPRACKCRQLHWIFHHRSSCASHSDISCMSSGQLATDRNLLNNLCMGRFQRHPCTCQPCMQCMCRRPDRCIPHCKYKLRHYYFRGRKCG